MCAWWLTGSPSGLAHPEYAPEPCNPVHDKDITGDGWINEWMNEYPPHVHPAVESHSHG